MRHVCVCYELFIKMILTALGEISLFLSLIELKENGIANTHIWSNSLPLFNLSVLFCHAKKWKGLNLKCKK